MNSSRFLWVSANARQFMIILPKMAMSALAVEIPVSPATDFSILPVRDERSTVNADIAPKMPPMPVGHA